MTDVSRPRGGFLFLTDRIGLLKKLLGGLE